MPTKDEMLHCTGGIAFTCITNNSKIEIIYLNINKTSFPFLVHFFPVELKQEYA